MTDPKIIFEAIQEANSILLHCHPSPDPDSYGSTLAMKYALEGIGKEVTLIQGDSEIPEGFMHFPGVNGITKKSFGEINLDDFDLFISLDSGSPEMVSRKDVPVFPLSIKSIVIDHHASNKGYADMNYVDTAPSTTFVLYKLFKEWGIKLTPEIAANLFIGLYTDTGGFRFPPTDYKTFEVAAELVRLYPQYIDMIATMENSHKKESIYGQALALSSVETFCADHLAIAAVSQKMLAEKNITADAITEGYISNILKSVKGWDIAVAMTEVEQGKIKISFRTRDVKKYEVSKLAVELGGGGGIRQQRELCFPGPLKRQKRK